jgi:hypothetical protein
MVDSVGVFVMKYRSLRNLLLFCLFAACLPISAQPPASAPDWSAWQFLVGDWIGEGGGAPGQGTGGFTFSLDLQNRVLVRKNFAEYPAETGRPAYRHDDLMIIYQEPGKPTRADYWDNEGHVIHYTATLAKDGNAVTFLSDSLATISRFRLTYARLGDGRLTILFEIAPPDHPTGFAKYLEATARKK